MQTLMIKPMFAPEDGTGAGAPPASGTSAAPPANDGSGAGAGSAADARWYDGLPGLTDEHKVFLAGKGYKGAPDLLTGAMLSDKLARDRNVMPRPDPTNLKAWDGWKELGWTETPADYKLKRPRVSDSFEFNNDLEAVMAKLGHDQRIPLPQMQALYDGFVGFAVDSLKAEETAAAEAQKVAADEDARQKEAFRKAMETKYGSDFNAKMDLASRAMRMLGLTDKEGAALEAVTGSEAFADLFVRIGEKIGEDTLLNMPGTAAGGRKTLHEIDAELSRQAGDPALMKALTDPTHPGHAAARRERASLLEAKAKLMDKAA